MRIIIGVAAHKAYWMPCGGLYLPIQAGSAGRPPLGWQRDDAGENISEKNATFCELTCLYWLWKHMEADAYGLAHYRRYFARGAVFGGRKRERILTGEDAARFLAHAEIVVPKKRRYWIETNYTQYIHAHHEEDLQKTKEILAKKYPECLPAWETVVNRRSGHRFNMFIMKKAQFDEYCSWLFDILFELESVLDISSYSAKDRRVFGYVGERLLDVWLEANSRRYVEAPVVNLENQHWEKKIATFLRRKIGIRDSEE